METSGLDIMMQAVFWGMVGLTVAGAWIAVFPRNILYNVLGLALALTGIGALFVCLGSPFIGLMQLLIYVGAVCIAIVFAIMLSRPMHLEVPPWPPSKLAMGVVASTVFFVAAVSLALKTDWTPSPDRVSDTSLWSVEKIGEALLTRYELVFEVISLVLLVAIIGAVITAGFSRRLSP
ncbi:MAG TPA: NADH-quinone oxidoreductase subunit J [Syntrophobacteraceae bacterium]|nr:NADH-quinone oxidoreductase subunit J [Syntrophobacteraceae bacterium]